MAIVTTSIIPTLTYFPWADRGGVIEESIQPVGELIANSRDEPVTLSGVGDTQELRWNWTLPPNNSYVCIDLTATINIPAAANTWEDVNSLIFFDTTELAAQTFEWGIGLISDGVAHQAGTVNQGKFYRPASPLPTFQQNAGGSWQAAFVNLTTNEPAANFNGTARFLVYTIGQQYDAAVNTPLLIR